MCKFEDKDGHGDGWGMCHVKLDFPIVVGIFEKPKMQERRGLN